MPDFDVGKEWFEVREFESKRWVPEDSFIEHQDIIAARSSKIERLLGALCIACFSLGFSCAALAGVMVMYYSI